MPIIKQGWLKKQGSFIKNWKKRWCVLLKNSNESKLAYYSDQGRTTLKGEIKLAEAEGCQAVGDNEKRFVIICPDRKWRLEAEDVVVRTQWIDAISSLLAEDSPKEPEATSKVSDGKPISVLAPGSADNLDNVPEGETVAAGTAIAVVDGKIESKEDKRDPAAQPAQPPPDWTEFDKQLDILIKAIDENANDSIQLNEFAEMYPEWSADFFKDFFAALDSDASKTLSREEFRKMFILQNNTPDTSRVVDTIDVVNELKFDLIFSDVCLIIDKNYDGKFNLDEFKLLKPIAADKLFDELDVNKDSVLSRTELKDMYRMAPKKTLNLQLVKQHLAMLEDGIYEGELEALCRMLDEEYQDGKINVSEYGKVYPEALKVLTKQIGQSSNNEIMRAALNQAFRLGDGSGDFEAVQDLMKNMKSLMFETHYTELCDLVDSNNDDVIDAKEFERMFPLAADNFFRQLDANGDMVLQRSELKQMFVLADGSMDVERVAQILADVTEKVEEQKRKADKAIDDFLNAEPEEALETKKEEPLSPLSPETEAMFEDPATKKAAETEKQETKTETAGAKPAQSEGQSKQEKLEQDMEEGEKKAPGGCCIIS